MIHLNGEIAGGFIAGLVAKEFRMVLDSAVFSPIAKLAGKRLDKLAQRYPLHWQPFRHYRHHQGRLKHCREGLCQAL